MAILWQSSLVPFIDPNGDPYAGAEAYFFDAGTTTPKTVYTDADFSVAHDHPVTASGAGMFPAIFLPSGDYRLRITDADGATLHDVDGISVPAVGDDEGEITDTPTELLFRTGQLIDRYGTGALSGWVRANGRTIGNATSGATERANDDTEDLFSFLWDQDSSLTVSGGRGANAASDYAAGKTITLPDFRHRVRVGLGTMGNTNANRIASAQITSGTNDTLGGSGGTNEVTLTIAQMPSHDHDGETGAGGAHDHELNRLSGTSGFDGGNPYGLSRAAGSVSSSSTDIEDAPNHRHSIPDEGGGQAHTNLQPFMLVTTYLKL